MKSISSTRQTALRTLLAIALMGLVATTSACSSLCLDDSCGAGDDDGGPDGGPDTGEPACTVFGMPHIGFDGEELAAKNNLTAYVDRGRAKPYSALLTEYARVLGASNRPASIDGNGPTFGDPPPRWYIEPLSSAVFVNTAYNVAFEGCLKLTGEISGGAPDARFATAPTADSAKTVCGEWMRKFWSREGTSAQIDECVAATMDATTEVYGGGSVTEVTRPTTPKRQWAYACASVLSSSGFLMY